jgi:hypothetical protein
MCSSKAWAAIARGVNEQIDFVRTLFRVSISHSGMKSRRFHKAPADLPVATESSLGPYSAVAVAEALVWILAPASPVVRFVWLSFSSVFVFLDRACLDCP